MSEYRTCVGTRGRRVSTACARPVERVLGLFASTRRLSEYALRESNSRLHCEKVLSWPLDEERAKNEPYDDVMLDRQDSNLRSPDQNGMFYH